MKHELIPAYKRLHAHNPTWFRGYSTKKWVEWITEKIEETNTTSLLDYGCGKGFQYFQYRYHELYWGGILPYLYDPAVSGLDKKPTGTFDGTICIDVLEHIPETDLDETVEEILNYAKKWCFFAIGIGRSRKKLPNGRNVHVTRWKEDKWLAFLGEKKRAFPIYVGFSIEKPVVEL